MYCRQCKRILVLFMLWAVVLSACDALVDADSFKDARTRKEEASFHILDVNLANDSADGVQADSTPEVGRSGEVETDCRDCGGCGLAPSSGPAQRMIFVAVGKGGHPGEGVDVDGNPDTCAPQNDCEGGVNNQLSGLFGMMEKFVSANGELTSAIATGDLNLVLEWGNYKGPDIAFDLAVHPATPDLPREECNWQLEQCVFTVQDSTFDPETCEPVVLFKNAVLANGAITAGGPESIFILPVPLSASAELNLIMRAVKIHGSVISGADGPYIVGGLIGGAVRYDDIIAAIQQIPESAYLPVGKETLITLLDLFVVPDVDTDDDGQPDAVSIGLKFEARPATISANSTASPP